MPPKAVYVGWPTKWANPFHVGDIAAGGVELSAEDAVILYKAFTAQEYPASELAKLRGRDLACWCELDQPCHADVLLELANQTQVVKP